MSDRAIERCVQIAEVAFECLKWHCHMQILLMIIMHTPILCACTKYVCKIYCNKNTNRNEQKNAKADEVDAAMCYFCQMIFLK